MTAIVDTHAFLWFVTGNRRLSRRARQAMERAPEHWCLSAASVWELAIKSSHGRLTLPVPLPQYLAGHIERGLRLLPIEWAHAARVETLPWHHRDPFDRVLIAQAQAEECAVVTHDAAFRAYRVRVIW